MEFTNTKWDLSEWSKEMKSKWLDKCILLGCTSNITKEDFETYTYLFISRSDHLQHCTNDKQFFDKDSNKLCTFDDMFPEYKITKGSSHNKTEWTDQHYNHNYTLTPEEIEQGFVKLDVYKVAKVWKIGSKDDSGCLWHTFKVFPRFGEKNSREREIIAMYKQIKCFAEIEGVDLENI